MASHYVFLDVNKQDSDQKRLKCKMEKIYCVCCLSQSTHLVNMSTCEHTSFLRGTLDQKLDLVDAHVCLMCHNMLKKIEEFKNQVQASVELLTSTNQVHNNKIKKLYNLRNTRLQIISVTDIENDNDMKPDIIIEVPKQLDIDNDIKTEDDFSDSESPYQETTKKRGKQFDKYEGKIKAMTLTLEELMEERERASKQEKYLRLPYRCEYCITAFDHEITWRTHMEKRHTKTENNFQCDICKSVLSSKIAYNEHMRRHMRRLECMECGKRYSTEQCAMQHYDENHLPSGSSLQRGYTCGECGFTTTVHRAYRYHKDKHKEKRQCTLCTNTFVNDSGLRMHMFTVHKQSSRTYRCEPCDKTYTTRSGLIAHKRAAHTFAPKSYCDTCRTHYPSAQALRTHLTTHSKHVNDNDKRFICDECGAKFLKKSMLQIHINWDHLKLNNNKCDICDKVFKYATALRRHVDYVHRKHRPPRNKICHYCGRGFTTQNILKFHLRTHTGERPLQCQHCQATFAHNGALYTHIKLKHAGVK